MGSYPGLSSDVSGGNTPPPQPQVCGELEGCYWRVGGVGFWKGGKVGRWRQPKTQKVRFFFGKVGGGIQTIFFFHFSFLFWWNLPLKIEVQFLEGVLCFFLILKGQSTAIHLGGVLTENWDRCIPSRTSCRDSNLVEAPVRSVRARQFWRGWGPVGKGSMVE